MGRFVPCLWYDGAAGQAGAAMEAWVGVSWQTLPRDAMATLADPDPARADPVMDAFPGMRKPDTAALDAPCAG